MLILASQSPRRRELLQQAGIAFVARTPLIDETQLPGERALDYVKRMARNKAEAVAAGPADIVLGADTSVVLNGRVFGKPRDAAEAVWMLRALSGRKHLVMSGICFKRHRELLVSAATTRVWFAAISNREIEEYVATGEPLDKAGAYAIQGLAAKF